MTSLLESLIIVSEKAANIARICRQNDHLFSLLIEEKRNDANPRFFQDFKTLADVLIQETIRYDISKKFPDLANFIQGEENNTFSNSLGENITVSIKESQIQTENLLSKVCGDDNICAGILAQETHKQITFEDVQQLIELELPIFAMEDMSNLGIWIDPIDSTLQYIQGVHEDSELEGVPAAGLICATVLIGVYCRRTGEPKIGIINQPFHTQISSGYQSKIYWGVSHDALLKSSSSKPVLNRDPLTIAISTSEEDWIISKLSQNGIKSVPLAGAGYKILNVILDRCDCYILSKGSTYKWDTCGPHAILKALGGGIIEFTKAVSSSATIDISKKFELIYNTDKKNSNGLIVYKNCKVLEKLLSILKN